MLCKIFVKPLQTHASPLQNLFQLSAFMCKESLHTPTHQTPNPNRAIILIMGFWCPLYYNYMKEPPEQHWELPIGSIVLLLGTTIEDPKYKLQKGTTMEPVGI